MAKSLHNKSESFDPFVVIPDKVHASTASPIKVAMADDDEALWELDEETLESGAVGEVFWIDCNSLFSFLYVVTYL